MLDIDGSIVLFSLIFMRVFACIQFNPLFGRTNIPIMVKGGIIMVLTILVYSVSEPVTIDTGNVIGYAALLLKELAVGYVLGMVFNFFASAIIFAGSVIDYQMGLSMSSIYDAQSNASISLSATLLNILLMVCFLTTDAHLVVLKIFLTSADIVPYGSIRLGPEVASAALHFFAQFISLALRIAMPMLAVQLFVEVGMGILMKTIPQINIFVVNIQTKILVGLLIILLLFFPMSDFMLDIIEVLVQSMRDMLVTMRG